MHNTAQHLLIVSVYIIEEAAFESSPEQFRGCGRLQLRTNTVIHGRFRVAAALRTEAPIAKVNDEGYPPILPLQAGFQQP